MRLFFPLVFLFLSLAALTGYAAEVHFFGQTDSDVVSDIPYGNNKEAGSEVNVGDARIYYEVYGAGDPILVLHGGAVGCPYEMGRFIDVLSKNYQVISPTTRGQGRSEIGTAPLTYAQKADDMMAAVNQVTQMPFIILGFSDGAYTAYKIASMYPDRVKKIIAIGAGENTPQTRMFPLMTLDELAQLDRGFIDEKIALCPEPGKLQDFLNRYFTFFNTERISKELFGSIRCPVLLIAGEKDEDAPLDTMISAYKMIPNAQLAIVANAPHPVFITNYDAVWANIEPFLKSEE